MKAFIDLYHKSIAGAISGWDRIRFRGTIRWLANASGMRTYLSTRGLLLKEFKPWAEKITAKVRAHCDEQARRLGIPMIYLRSGGVDKEALARKIMNERGVSTGDVCMLSVVEPCQAPVIRGYEGKLHLEMQPRKCVWIYHYGNDERFGFGHLRLQTWLPLSVSVCLNGRHWLERSLLREGIGYVKDGNCFVQLSDYARAQELLDEQQKSAWPEMLEGFLNRWCPGLRQIIGERPLEYYWSADETEWATDLLWREPEQLDRLFPKLARYGLLTAQSPTVMRFLGRCLKGPRPNEVISHLQSRYEGLCLKHWVNHNSVKMYNKAGNVLRVETTINQTREFKVYRCAHDDPSQPATWQKMRKGVSDLNRRAQISQASNERYLDHLAAADSSESLKETLDDLCRRREKDGRGFRAINPWNPEDFRSLEFLARGEVSLNGFRNRDLREALYPNHSASEAHRLSGCVTRRLRLLRAHGLIKKAPRTHRYLLTAKGHKIVAALLAASAASTEQLMKSAA